MDSAAWDERYRQSGWLWNTAPNRFVAEVLADRAAGRGLDLACGEGRNAVWLAGRGWRMTAVDFSSVAIDKARRLEETQHAEAAQPAETGPSGTARHPVEWLVRDVTQYEPPAGSFDLVLISYLHLPAADFEAVLDRAAAALAPGGTLLVVGHDATNIAEGTGGPQDPTVLTTPEAMSAVVEKTAEVRGISLRIERAERVRRPVEGAPRPAIDCLLVVSRG